MYSYINGRSRGFTMIEVIVVIGIIGVLAAVVITSLSTARSQSRDKQRIIDIKNSQLTFRLYLEQASLSTYPSSATYDAGVEIGIGGAIDTLVSGVGKLPKDQKSGTGSYKYMYDSSYTCSGSNHKVLYVNTFETGTTLANEDATCGTTGSGKYVVVLE